MLPFVILTLYPPPSRVKLLLMGEVTVPSTSIFLSSVIVPPSATFAIAYRKLPSAVSSEVVYVASAPTAIAVNGKTPITMHIAIKTENNFLVISRPPLSHVSRPRCRAARAERNSMVIAGHSLCYRKLNLISINLTNVTNL